MAKDHIPPQLLFPTPRPANLITVPVCCDCHFGTSKDDEYFRLKISLRHDAASRPEARENWSAVFRSLGKREATGLRNSFFTDIRTIQLHTPAGIYVGRALGYDVDMDRIRRVVERTIRGLYFTERHSPLGLTNEVRVYTNEDLQEQAKEALNVLTKNVLLPLAAQTPKVIGNDVFSYRFHISNEAPIHSVWALVFYGAVPFLCLTGPRTAPAGEAGK